MIVTLARLKYQFEYTISQFPQRTLKQGKCFRLGRFILLGRFPHWVEEEVRAHHSISQIFRYLFKADSMQILFARLRLARLIFSLRRPHEHFVIGILVEEHLRRQEQMKNVIQDM